MPYEVEEVFKECEACAAKPGAPLLCAGCLHNRTLINNLLESRRQAREQFKLVSPERPDFSQMLNKLKETLKQ